MKQLNIAIENMLMAELKSEAAIRELTLFEYVSNLLENRKK
jgi:hypothetical protein